jgi:hypothetical protein
MAGQTGWSRAQLTPVLAMVAVALLAAGVALWLTGDVLHHSASKWLLVGVGALAVVAVQSAGRAMAFVVHPYDESGTEADDQAGE